MRRDVPNERRHSRVFWLAVILGTAGMLAAASAVGAAVGSVHRASMGTGRVSVAGFVLSYPELNGAEWILIGLAGVGAAAITIAVRAAWRQRFIYRSFVHRVEVLGRLDGHPTVKVIAGSRPEAFCAGYLRPTVYISEGALESLTSAELHAVLAHEYHHRLVRDPLRFAVGRILARALFFVPVLRALLDRYADLAELNADGAAVRASAGRQGPLASALLLFDASAPPGVSGISSARVDSLLGEPVRWRLPLSLTAASLVALSALSLLIWQVSGGASVRATFNLPFLSSQPCLVMLIVLPLFGCVAALRRRTRAGGTVPTAT
ncbi:MAG TPA: M56 family metallopeptidase, partial [Solirubrobacteraceae bacterium]